MTHQYQAKPNEVVVAHFKGGETQAGQILEWIQAVNKSATAVWMDEHYEPVPGNTEGQILNVPESIVMQTRDSIVRVPIGDYIVLTKLGGFRRVTPEELAEDYELIE